MGGRTLVSEASIESEEELVCDFSCPVCFKDFANLKHLNRHLDSDHGFGESNIATSGYSKLSNDGKYRPNKISQEMERVERERLKPFEPGRSSCHECKVSLNKNSGVANCKSCGELFCSVHCQNVIKLNSQGQYEPHNGNWCLCCYKCFSERPGFNDYCSVRDLTTTLKELRQAKNEDKQLQVLQLENRLVRLVDGIAKVFRQHRGALLMSLKVKTDISNLERTVTPWREDRDVLACFICDQAFGLTLRKHHCRLCGNVICDSEVTNCSNRIPIGNLVNAANDLLFTEPREELQKCPYSIRVCSNCVRNLYFERKFKWGLHQPLNPLLSQCERIHDTSQVILNLLPLLEESLERIESSKQAEDRPNQAAIDKSTKLRMKLLRAVASYNKLSKQISNLRPKNNAERKIQQSIQMASSIFINEKILQLKALPGVNQRLVEDVQEDANAQVIKLSDIVFNNLTIKEIKQSREDLMVLKEQKFLVETMIDNAKKQRNFDEIVTLDANLKELESKIKDIQESLGDQGFS